MGFHSINDRDIYTDLLREFIRNGHKVYIVSPSERRNGEPEGLIEEENSVILRVVTGNVQKTNVIEKGVSTVLIESKFVRAIKKYFAALTFDLVLYATPPITLVGAIRYLKNRDHAKTYLCLKDIFPQNALDLGMMSKTGVKGLLYRAFRSKEKELYRLSDYIGCMSQANVDYLLRHNPEIDPASVEVCPNSVEVCDRSIGAEQRRAIREKYGIPQGKKVFLYGGNLGRPQGIPFLIECLEKCAELDEAFFLIVGDGTEFGKLKAYADSAKQGNLKLMKRLPKDDYETMIAACDVGLLFLDHRFTIPNFPSRMLGYMQAGLPVLAATDPNTDVGRVIVEGGFGWWCESDDAEGFAALVRKILSLPEETRKEYGLNAFDYLVKHYSVESTYRTIMRRMEQETAG